VGHEVATETHTVNITSGDGGYYLMGPSSLLNVNHGGSYVRNLSTDWQLKYIGGIGGSESVRIDFVGSNITESNFTV
jgi:hypothetical protein